MIIDICKVFGTQLQGESLGKKHYARIWEILSDSEPGEVVVLDFKSVDVVTGSWISAMLVPFYRRATQEEIDVFPILCNVGDGWLDDLTLLSKWMHQHYLITAKCTALRKARLVGALDPGQRTTLEAVMELKSVTGAELARVRKSENTLATAWNNRLKDLHEKRLLKRTKRGREQVYSPVVEAIEFDG